MNSVNLIGRLTRDPELRYSQNSESTAVTKFTLAVNREYNPNGKQEADFIRCTAFGKTAETITNYLRKGEQTAVSGRIQTGSYQDKDGKTVYTTDVIVNRFDFIGNRGDSKSSEPKQSAPEQVDMGEAFMEVDDNIPF